MIRRNESVIGESIEMKLRKITESNKNIPTDDVPMMYSADRDNPISGTDIRTDRFEIARIAKDQLQNIAAQKSAIGQEKGTIYNEETDEFILPAEEEQSNPE